MIHLPDNSFRPLHCEEIFYLEAEGNRTLVRLRGKRPLIDKRTLAEVESWLPQEDFVRIHRSFIVNLDRISRLQPRDSGRDWEVRMEPPVNQVLPVSRSGYGLLVEAFCG